MKSKLNKKDFEKIKNKLDERVLSNVLGGSSYLKIIHPYAESTFDKSILPPPPGW